MNYNFNDTDFHKAFGFAVEYYLSKNLHTGRTSGEPRGLGAVIDAFVRGKLVEIGVQNLLEDVSEKKMHLDFDMKSISEVATEPDIINIEENNNVRDPALFIEIKSTSLNDRWIGLTEEQMQTMVTGAENRKIINVYCSLSTDSTKTNPSSSDIVGMYLKEVTNLDIFEGFSDLNLTANLEFILTLEDLQKHGTIFKSGKLLYETEMFPCINSIKKKDGNLKKDISFTIERLDYSGNVKLARFDGSFDEEYGIFYVEGSYKLYIKENRKSVRHYIECIEDTYVSNNVFGLFKLHKGNTYLFNLVTIGRDPVLKRNNLWIAKRRLYQLIENNTIEKPEIIFNYIAKNI